MEKNDRLMPIELIHTFHVFVLRFPQDMIFLYMEPLLLHIYKIIQDINSFISPLLSLSDTHMST